MDELIENLRAVVGRDGVLSEPDELLVYECDGLPQHKYPPRVVVFPRSTEEVAEVLRVLAREEVPFSPRGAGTGLSGGALAVGRGVVVELARMRRLIKIDPDNRLAIVETGLVNAKLSHAAAPFGLHYVPDPSSQAACTIGGNIAENAGGIHCLKYGMTVDHVMAARVVLAGGEIIDLADGQRQTPGYDLLGVFVGSEGTFGIATEATLRLVSLPPAVRTMLADFTNIDDASRAVSAIIAAGLVPSALEMVDGATIRAVEASVFAAGLPLGAEAALLIELDGLVAGLDEEAARCESICREYRARDVRRARDERERKKFWAARKGAFGAMGRLAPDVMIQDAVVPRSRLPEVLAETYRVGAKYRLRLANVFHAGDGNLHPFISFDSRDQDEARRVKEAGREIMETCVRAGGTITGEHGVGLDKSAYLPLIFSADDMDAMLRVRAAFDPTGLCNPGKIIPTSRSCGEARAVTRGRGGQEKAEDSGRKAAKNTPNLSSAYRPTLSAFLSPPASPHASVPASHQAAVANDDRQAPVVTPASLDEACEVLRMASRDNMAVVPSGGGTWLDVGNPMRRADLIVSTSRIKRIIEHEPADLVATAEAGVTLAELNAELSRAGQWLPLDPPDDGRATVGGVVATGLGGAHQFGYGPPRASVIGMRVALADGRVVKAGGRVVKNVAGYDLCKLFTGSCGTLCLITEVTFKLCPLPLHAATLQAYGSLASLLDGARALLASQLLPVALEIVSPSMARAVGVIVGSEEDHVLLIRFAGTEQAVTYQAERARTLLQEERTVSVTFATDEANVWRELAAVPLRHADQLIWRACVRPAETGLFLKAIHEGEDSARSASSAFWHAGLGDGRVRVIDSPLTNASARPASLAALRERAQEMGGSLVIENAPPEIKNALDSWGDAGAVTSLMRRIKKQLDPNDAFSSGRLFASI